MDDITIEDEIDPNDPVPIKQTSLPSYFQLLSDKWFIVFLVLVVMIISLLRNRFRQNNADHPSERSLIDPVNRLEEMERVRQRQQKAYEEERLLKAQRKQEKLEELKKSTNENVEPTRYRSTDHNPLTGQSNRSSGDSCAWRPSSRRKPGAGG